MKNGREDEAPGSTLAPLHPSRRQLQAPPGSNGYFRGHHHRMLDREVSPLPLDCLKVGCQFQTREGHGHDRPHPVHPKGGCPVKRKALACKGEDKRLTAHRHSHTTPVDGPCPEAYADRHTHRLLQHRWDHDVGHLQGVGWQHERDNLPPVAPPAKQTTLD